MPKQELLPGVTTVACPPLVVCDAKREIRRARRIALFRDAAQIALLLCVDYLFSYWPEARLPFLTRAESLVMLRGINVALVAHVWMTRAFPKWQATRIASTWSRGEREAFRQKSARAA
jgi:hypothetical protein